MSTPKEAIYTRTLTPIPVDLNVSYDNVFSRYMNQLIFYRTTNHPLPPPRRQQHLAHRKRFRPYRRGTRLVPMGRSTIPRSPSRD